MVARTAAELRRHVRYGRARGHRRSFRWRHQASQVRAWYKAVLPTGPALHSAWVIQRHVVVCPVRAALLLVAQHLHQHQPASRPGCVAGQDCKAVLVVDRWRSGTAGGGQGKGRAGKAGKNCGREDGGRGRGCDVDEARRLGPTAISKRAARTLVPADGSTTRLYC